jgi:hypothetical protein
MSFMRGVVENTIRNMSPEERSDALRTVTSQVVTLMSEQERVDALVHIFRELSASIPAERLEAALSDLNTSS